MGNLVWHDWARFVSISACVYGVWAAWWGIFYRKFFWDFIGGVIRTPGGIQPPPSADFFVDIIVKVPFVQILVLLHASFLIALEWPLPYLKKFAIYRSFVFRTVMLVAQAFLAFLFYQGTNCAIWSLIASGAYTRAHLLGETMEEAKDNRGRGGGGA